MLTVLQLKFVSPADCLLYIISARVKGKLGPRPFLAYAVDPDRMEDPKTSASKETDSRFLPLSIPNNISYYEGLQRRGVE